MAKMNNCRCSKLIFLIISLILFGSVTYIIFNRPTLVLVQLINRHGDRAPDLPFPHNDPYADDIERYWPSG